MGALTLQYDERLGPVFEDLEPAHESSSNDIEQTVSRVKVALARGSQMSTTTARASLGSQTLN